MQKGIVILILYLIVITIFSLGIRFILKKKMWKPANYFTITIIGIIFILVVYQLRVIVGCFSSSLESMGNSNTIFKLIDNNGSPINSANLANSINYGRGMKSNDYANNNHAKTCKANEFRELDILVTASTQQLNDAKNTYEVLKNIYTVVNDANKTESDIITELNKQMAKLKTDVTV